MKRFTRRQVVTGSAAAVLGVTSSSSNVLAQADQSVDAAADSDGWIELEAGIKETTLDGHRVRLRTYNGQVPGPLLTVTPGETLRIRLKNSLPPYDSSGWNGNHNVPHGLDHTNLHLHGLDVLPHLFDPLGTSDQLAPMISIPPGGHYDYVFDIPENHPPGFNWYHPHKHGSTAVQAVTGMAGGLVIRGALDEVPEIKAAREIILAMQDIGLFPTEDDPDLWAYEPVQNAMWNGIGNVTINGKKVDLKSGFSTGDYLLHYYLLNGEPFFKETSNEANPQKPDGTQLSVQRFKLAPGEVVRFLMLNGNSVTLMPIVVEEHDVHLMAMDGVNFPEVRKIAAKAEGDSSEQLLLAPANRAEFLIKANTKPGIYRIRQITQDDQFGASPGKIIAEIEVAGEPKDMALPTSLPVPSREYPLIKEEEITRWRKIEFDDGFPPVMNPVVGVDFLINNASYDEFEVPTVVKLNGVEEWHIIVGDSHHGGGEGHPFHIHVNSFEVISINGEAQPPGLIQDTIWVPSNSTVVIRMRFKDYVGKAVYHCHILPHEDTGMMQNFLIVDPAKIDHG